MINRTKRFSNYAGEIAIGDLILGYQAPLDIYAGLVLDIEDSDSPSALLAITPVSEAALETIGQYGIDMFTSEVNLIDYPLLHINADTVILLDTEDKIKKAIVALSNSEKEVRRSIGMIKNIFENQKNS
ncbi:hypothetical protein [Ewingella americana]|uniref:Uncharacterized protein n=1 Tax=Ewingella americana TaxID=41202 RepID=A0A502GD89_9GAMM|nr:hypothetical protein [Ewingella americana]TPG59895.1 hypothetical protein EAH77_15120 [Ewingella americana]